MPRRCPPERVAVSPVYRLWFAPMSAAMAPCSVLEELGTAYELVDLRWGEPRPDGYERLHPLARIPVLEVDGVPVFESVAIVMHLCDRHPEAGLAPPPGSIERAHYYQWLVFYASTLHAANKPHGFPQRFTDEPAGEAAVKRAATRNVAQVLRIVEQRLGAGPWVLGDTYSACDHALHQYCCWYEQPEPGHVALADYPDLVAFTARVRARSPGVRAMLARNAALLDA